jgi:predicted amidohydrolase YtcJ
MIYYGGPIYTMILDGDRVEALAVRAGEIVATGSLEAILVLKGPDTKLVDLQGKCMMPGFIDPHSHVIQQSLKFSVVNLDPHPIGDVRSIADIQRKLKERIKERQPEPGQWVFGWGYDDTGVEEKRHPTRDDLDAVSTEHPIVLMHISSHLMTSNSKALEVCGITSETQDPEGGKLQRRDGSEDPNGVMEEKAMGLLLAKVPGMAPDRALEILRNGLKKYAEAGITTAQEGAAVPPFLKLLEAGDKAGVLPIDIVSYPVYLTTDDDLIQQIADTWRTPARYRMGGIKLVLDGSIQGYTANLSQPYHIQPGGAQALQDCTCDSNTGLNLLLESEGRKTGASLLRSSDDENDAFQVREPKSGGDYRGYANMTIEEIRTFLDKADRAGIPVIAHCNGDAAVDDLIEAVRTVRGKRPRPDLRTVIIHAQTIREDQLNFAANQGLVPSFFPIHVTFWGDRHRDIFLGPDRAARISPSRSALDRGMKITLHHDAPVAGCDMLGVVSAAVNRLTTSGKQLGPEQAITPYEAFRAITKDAAWQYFEEHRKGTLEVGKLADFVILRQDPFEIAPGQIANIKIDKTIKEGVTVFDSEDVSTDQDAADVSLQGTWQVESLGGEPIAAGVQLPSLSMTPDGKVSGFTSVNRFQGHLASEGDKLSGPLITTRRAGPPAAMKVESTLLAALGRATYVKRHSEGIALFDESGARLMVLKPDHR